MSDDPRYQCGYCAKVRDDPDAEDGSGQAWDVPVLYRGIHPECEEMVRQYQDEVRNSGEYQ